jgi:hypothetical protein
MNLNDALSFNDVQSTIKYLRNRGVIADDVGRFDQFCNLKTSVQSVQNGEDVESDKGVKYFQKGCNADCHSKLLKKM